MTNEAQPHTVSSLRPNTGLTCAPEDWAALVKVANGETDLSRDDLRRLFMLGLVERQCRVVRLSNRGRILLGLPD